MKLSSTINRNFFNHYVRCERNSLQSLYSRLLPLVHGLFIPVKRKWLSLQTWTAHVGKEVLAGLNALLLSILSQINRRIFVGLGMMGVVAPLSGCMYLIFDRGDYVQNWYHVNYFHLFLILGPSLFVLSCLVGVWFMFPYRSARAYSLAIPGGFTIGKILWLIQCTSNADFYSIVPSSFILIGALVSMFLFTASDWLVHNVFHRQDAFERRIGTLYNGLNVLDGETFKTAFKKYVEEKKAFNKQF